VGSVGSVDMCWLDRGATWTGGVRSTWGAWVNIGHVGQTAVHGTSNARATHYAWGWLASPSDGPIGLSSKVMNSMCAVRLCVCICMYVYIYIRHRYSSPGPASRGPI
jgi:hypothetical protein